MTRRPRLGRWPSIWAPLAPAAPRRAARAARLGHSLRTRRDLVPAALGALDRGGTLAVAGIHLSEIPSLDYQRHLFEERTLQSVTANTRQDGEEFLAEAARIGIRVSTVAYPIDRADAALRDLPRTASTVPPS